MKVYGQVFLPSTYDYAIDVWPDHLELYSVVTLAKFVLCLTVLYDNALQITPRERLVSYYRDISRHTYGDIRGLPPSYG